VQGHYTRAEVEAAYCFAETCGYGVLSTNAPWIHREGVLWHQASATDLLFITLRKSAALFSPSTRYRDLALGPSLFHWESQSTTTASSATGQRYIHHADRGSRVLLFVPEQRKQDGRAGGPLRACSLFLATGSPAGLTSFSWPSDPQAKRRPIRAMDHDEE
jgi:hypothetical protein